MEGRVSKGGRQQVREELLHHSEAVAHQPRLLACTVSALHAQPRFAEATLALAVAVEVHALIGLAATAVGETAAVAALPLGRHGR